MRLSPGALFAIVALAPLLAHAEGAPAEEKTESASAPAHSAPALVLPVIIDDGARRKPDATEPELFELTSRLSELLLETAHDLGLSTTTPLAWPDTTIVDPTKLTDTELVGLAHKVNRSVVLALIRPLPKTTTKSAAFELRIAMATPSHKSLFTRTEPFDPDNLAVRAVVMLRDLVTDAAPSGTPKVVFVPLPSSAQPAPAQRAGPPRSEGRTILAVNATVFGGMMGLSVERASGSNDPRLLYPLLAVGAGVGLGASLLIADEWDVGVGDAWFLSSGAIWPTAAAHLLFEGRFGNSTEAERWSFGLVGGSLGLTLSTLSLALGDMESGGAALAHSGGAFGLAAGAFTEWLVDGSTRDAPFAGMGYGAALGWLAAASAATTRVHVDSGRVLTIDLGAVLGGLGGAALASPLLFDRPTSTHTRGWVGATFGGTLIGAGVAWWLTRPRHRGSSPSPGKDRPAGALRIAPGTTLVPDFPEVGIIGQSALMAPAAGTSSEKPEGRSLPAILSSELQSSTAPIVGVKFRGRW